MRRPNKFPVMLSMDQLLRRGQSARLALLPFNFHSQKTVMVPRSDGNSWTVHATKARPWAVRSTNRRRNKAARAARKANRR